MDAHAFCGGHYERWDVSCGCWWVECSACGVDVYSGTCTYHAAIAAIEAMDYAEAMGIGS